ncbi:MAG: DUF3160 domain-containing protein, partial [bacterium]|nr:DUF3160 domain-containing protein [bacterium]
AKQSYTGSSKGFAPLPDRGGAWLEPAAELYARLARSAAELAARFQSREFAAFAELLERCIRIAVVERAGLPLQAEDVDFLNGLDAELLRLVGRNDAPIVVDVHTDPASGQVLQEGIGFPQVVEKALGSSRVSRGALFRHYELKHPLGDRLTDEAWLERLLRGPLPPPTVTMPSAGAPVQ